jgi:hypothetical protein
MISIKKVNTLFVLLLLLFSMIPVAVADPGIIKGTDEKIDVLYIGWVEDDYPNMKIADDMSLYYENDFSIVICDIWEMYGGEVTEE